jgi:hypothetical protein
MASQAPVVTQADLDAYIASYQKAQADQAAALAAAQATGMSDRYTQLYGGADIVPGTTQGILSNMGIENPYLPVYSLIGSASVGNDLANERMQFAPIPGVSYRLVDKTTGETTTANTPEEIKALIAQSNALSAAGGKGANLAIESNQTGSWSPVFTDEPNPLFNDITKIALAGMIAATGAGLLQPGGLGGVGAAGTTGAGAAGAGTAAGAAGLAPVATVAAAAPAAAAATTDLVVTALMSKGFTAAQAAALVASGGAAAALSSSGAAGSTTGTTAASNATNTMPTATTTGPDLLLTAQQTGSTIPAVVPAAAAATTAAATATTPAATSNTPAPNPAEDLTLTAQTQPTNLLPAEFLAPAAVAAAAAANAAGATTTAAETASTRTTPTAEETAALNAGAGAGGILGTGLSATQLATLASIGVSGLNSLFGGGSGGGTGAGTPYVSALGAMPSFTPRTQINPNITDYERYGYGPEALFFSGGQRLDTYTPTAATTAAQTISPVATPAATTPAATPTNLIDSAAGGVNLTLNEGAGTAGTGPQIGGNLGPATPENTGMTQERLDQLQDRFENMRSGEFFNYFKSVNDVLGNYAAKGIITPNDAQVYQSRLEAAASTPGATLASLQSAVPMPQISDFIGPTGTRPVYTYTAPSQPIVDRSAYINDLYKQLGAQVSQGFLPNTAAQNIQSQLRQTYLNPQSTTEQLQNVYNTAIQQYRPLI